MRFLIILLIFISLNISYNLADNKNNFGSKQSNHGHPLDPLTSEEIFKVTSIINQFTQFSNIIFIYITLQEPDKALLLLPYFLRDQPISQGIIKRRALVDINDLDLNQTSQFIINLDTNQIDSFTQSSKEAPYRPPLTQGTLALAEKIMRNDKDVQERCSKLGYSDMSLVFAQSMSARWIEPIPKYIGKRLRQVYLYGANFLGDNYYVHPFDFIAIVDLDGQRVVGIEELPTHSGFNTDKSGNNVPRAEYNYDPDYRDPKYYREEPKPIITSQPYGVNYLIDGNKVIWQKFKFRVGFNPREGLILYHINYKDGGETRPLFYRLSLAELYVTHGDPRPPLFRKIVFYEGQDGVGFSANDLKPGVDCLGEVYYFEGVVPPGNPLRIPKAICLFEEDAGILWKHTEWRNGKSVAVRSQRLVLSMTSTFGNYDYIFTWYFYHDARIEFNVKVTGIQGTNLMSKDKGVTPGGYGSIVWPQIDAIYHLHFFTLRIDADIDGVENSVATVDVVPLDFPTGSPQNPFGNEFTLNETILKTMGGARTKVNATCGRTWIMKSGRKNPFTKEDVSWRLEPWNGPPGMRKMDSPMHARSPWLDYNLWVTPYKEGQFYPAGYYLNNSGLAQWVRENPEENVENVDVVLWHVFSIASIPRVEDFPVMSVESCGITLKPVNFFTENPALDVPPVGWGWRSEEL